MSTIVEPPVADRARTDRVAEKGLRQGAIGLAGSTILGVVQTGPRTASR